jgi:hypothetical protein
MTTITRDDLEAKRKKHLKYFDYTELPIKKWISSYLDKHVREIFDDYDEENYDVILFNYKNKQWCVEYELEEHNHIAMIDSNFWKEEKCEKLDESVKILLEAMSIVYYSITNTLTNKTHKKSMENIVPKFDVETLSFYLQSIVIDRIQYNSILHRLNMFTNKKNGLQHFLNTDDIEDIDRLKIMNEIKTIDEEIKKITLESNKYDEKEIEKKEIETNEFNKTILNKKRLFINVYEIEEIEEELKMKRLPEIAPLFKFDDEETLVDQLKKL